MAFGYLTSGNAGCATAASPVPVTINSTGAGALFAVITTEVSIGIPLAPSDSKGNTWQLVISVAGSFHRSTLFISLPTSVGTGHVITANPTGIANVYAAIAVSAYSITTGITTGQLKYATATSTGSLQPGSLTPASSNSMILTVFGLSVAGTISISGGPTIRATNNFVGSLSYGTSIADWIQTTATASNPTWSNTASAPDLTAIQIELYDAVGIIRESAVPLITSGSGGAAVRESAVPLVTLTSNISAITYARTSAAPLTTLDQQTTTPNRASAVPLLYLISNAAPAVLTGFSIDCLTKNMTITGTGFPTAGVPPVHITMGGVPVDFTFLYNTTTQIVVHINNFVNGKYSVKVG